MNRDEAHNVIVNILSDYDFGGFYNYKRRDAANDILDTIWLDRESRQLIEDSVFLGQQLQEARKDITRLRARLRRCESQILAQPP